MSRAAYIWGAPPLISRWCEVPLCRSKKPHLSSDRHVLALPPAPVLQSNQRSEHIDCGNSGDVSLCRTFPHFGICFFLFLFWRNCRKYRLTTAISLRRFITFLAGELFKNSHYYASHVQRMREHFIVWTFYGDHTHTLLRRQLDRIRPHKSSRGTLVS
jgi:hypothetical protein